MLLRQRSGPSLTATVDASAVAAVAAERALCDRVDKVAMGLGWASS